MMAFITRFNLVLVWSKIVQIWTKKSSKWVQHNQVSWSCFYKCFLVFPWISSYFPLVPFILGFIVLTRKFLYFLLFPCISLYFLEFSCVSCTPWYFVVLLGTPWYYFSEVLLKKFDKHRQPLTTQSPKSGTFHDMYLNI